MKVSLTLSILLLFAGGCSKETQNDFICNMEQQAVITSNVDELNKTTTDNYTMKVEVDIKNNFLKLNGVLCGKEELFIEENEIRCGEVSLEPLSKYEMTKIDRVTSIATHRRQFVINHEGAVLVSTIKSQGLCVPYDKTKKAF